MDIMIALPPIPVSTITPICSPAAFIRCTASSMAAAVLGLRSQANNASFPLSSPMYTRRNPRMRSAWKSSTLLRSADRPSTKA